VFGAAEIKHFLPAAPESDQ